MKDFGFKPDFGFKLVCAISVFFVIIAAVAITVVGTTPKQLDRGSDRFDRIEKHQRESDERIDRIASSLRAAVRPIGWDVPGDGGR